MPEIDISFVIPVFNEANTLSSLVQGIFEHTGPIELEILLIDDGSTDKSAKIIEDLAKKHPEIRPINLGSHQGKTEALKKGFEAAQGEIVITMDSDLQDDPAEIPQFLAKLAEGNDLVCGWKQHRRDPKFRVRASAIYNAFVRALFGVQLRDVNCGFKAMRAEVTKSIVNDLKRDYHRLIPVLAHRKAFKLAELGVTHHPRRHGQSKYGPSRYLRAFLDVTALKLGV